MEDKSLERPPSRSILRKSNQKSPRGSKKPKTRFKDLDNNKKKSKTKNSTNQAVNGAASPHETFNNNVEKLLKPPTIYEMAQANFCPPPLYYFKKTTEKEKKSFLNDFPKEKGLEQLRNFSDQYYTPNLTQNLADKDNESIKRNSLKKNLNKQANEEPKTNLIVLNEKMTTSLLSNQNFQLNLKGAGIVDIFLQEMIKLKLENEKLKNDETYSQKEYMRYLLNREASNQGQNELQQFKETEQPKPELEPLKRKNSKEKKTKRNLASSSLEELSKESNFFDSRNDPFVIKMLFSLFPKINTFIALKKASKNQIQSKNLLSAINQAKINKILPTLYLIPKKTS